MSSVHPIVAGVEHLSAGDPILGVAAELARGSGAALHLVHAYELPHLHFHPPHLPPEGTAEELRRLLEAAAGAVPGAEGAVAHAEHGTPARVLLRVAEEVGAALVVVGERGGSRRGHGFLGSTAQRVLRTSPAPVLVVRRPARHPLERVLVATDLSALSAAAHDRGVETVEALFGGTRTTRSLLVVGHGNLPAPLPDAALARTARAELRLFLRARLPRPARVEPVVRTGFPAEEIVAEAREWDADLLVVGTHGRVLLGSVAEAVLRAAPCNVLAVPPHAPEPEIEALEADVEAPPEAAETVAAAV